jgi:7-cyano-7-deazaguanine synthase
MTQDPQATDRARTALCLLSGGQDSTTCLAWALTNSSFDKVHTIGFDYLQRHRVELDARVEVLRALRETYQPRLGSDTLVKVHGLAQISDSALTGDVEIRMGESGLPTTFVPGRNILFLTYAAALAYRIGASHIIGGMCETDYSGYPDCRRHTIDALEETLQLGMECNFTIHTPLMQKTKAQTWAMARAIGGDDLVRLIINKTHTCYRGDHSTFHEWGYGCGECPACDIRMNGFNQWVDACNAESPAA